MSCDVSYNHDHIPFYYPRNKINKKEKKRIKSKKIDKKKRKLK